MKDYIEIIGAKFVRNHVLAVTFSNQIEALVNLEEYFKAEKNIFKKLFKTKKDFKKFHIDMAGGIAWDCGADIGPDVLYHLATKPTKQ